MRSASTPDPHAKDTAPFSYHLLLKYIPLQSNNSSKARAVIQDLMEQRFVEPLLWSSYDLNHLIGLHRCHHQTRPGENLGKREDVEAVQQLAEEPEVVGVLQKPKRKKIMEFIFGNKTFKITNYQK